MVSRQPRLARPPRRQGHARSRRDIVPSRTWRSRPAHGRTQIAEVKLLGAPAITLAHVAHESIIGIGTATGAAAIEIEVVVVAPAAAGVDIIYVDGSGAEARVGLSTAATTAAKRALKRALGDGEKRPVGVARDGERWREAGGSQLGAKRLGLLSEAVGNGRDVGERQVACLDEESDALTHIAKLLGVARDKVSDDRMPRQLGLLDNTDHALKFLLVQRELELALGHVDKHLAHLALTVKAVNSAA
eukprot:scaffold30745_cov28-Tisochrysis_lutea.AAC.3